MNDFNRILHRMKHALSRTSSPCSDDLEKFCKSHGRWCMSIKLSNACLCIITNCCEKEYYNMNVSYLDHHIGIIFLSQEQSSARTAIGSLCIFIFSFFSVFLLGALSRPTPLQHMAQQQNGGPSPADQRVTRLCYKSMSCGISAVNAQHCCNYFETLNRVEKHSVAYKQ